MQIVIDTKDTVLHTKDKCFLISNGRLKRQISPIRVTSIAILSNCMVSASATMLAARHQVPLMWFDNLGSIQARTWSPYFTGLASLRQMQLAFWARPGATAWVIEGFALKTNIQTANLTWLAHGRPALAGETKKAIAEMGLALASMSELANTPMAGCRNRLLGLEGNLSKRYWEAMQPYLPETLRFAKRSRRPAEDGFNAALNYLYGMAYAAVEGAVFATGLDPMAGIMHVEGYKRPTLVFDLIEPFRPVVDRMLLNHVLDGAIKEEYFTPKPKGVWLSRERKRFLIPELNGLLEKRTKFNNRNTTLRNHMHLYANSLAEHIRNHTPSNP